jgi:hypothetical protein
LWNRQNKKVKAISSHRKPPALQATSNGTCSRKDPDCCGFKVLMRDCREQCVLTAAIVFADAKKRKILDNFAENSRSLRRTCAIWTESESMTVPHTSALISFEVNMLWNICPFDSL